MNTSINARKMKNISTVILLISVLYVLAVSGWMITGNRSIITVMEVLTVWAAVVILKFMTELYKGSGDSCKSPALMALVLSACMATTTIMNHFIYITVLNQLYGAKMPSWLLLDGWPSLSKGLECVAWGFFLGLAMLFSFKPLKELGSDVMAWTMAVSGALTLTGLIGPITGNMSFYNLSTVGYSVGFLVLSIEMLVFLRKREKTAAQE